ncbi:MAG: zinc ribbon domain-containing protein [Planctomycetota bacterium]|nr:zinc ribbon domain-containing protein [Planctomycetota bacterium]
MAEHAGRPRRKGAKPLGAQAKYAEPAASGAGDSRQGNSDVAATAPVETAVCPKCQGVLEAGATFCGHCGASLATGRKRTYKPGDRVRKSMQRNRESKIKGGRNVLLILGMLHFLVAAGIYVYLSVYADELSVAGETGLAAQGLMKLVVFYYGGLGVVFSGLYLWARSSPLPALVCGLVVYLTFMVVAIVINPASLLSPIAWIIRLGIVGAFTGGIKSALEMRRIERGLSPYASGARSHAVRRKRKVEAA